MMKRPGRLITKPPEPHDYRRLYSDADSGPPLKKLATGATLAQLSTDYALFTIAPLVLWGGLPVNPIREWLNEQGLMSGCWTVPLSGPVVHLGYTALHKFWASKLWACEKQIWEPLCFRLGTVAMINRDTRTFARSVCQVLPAPDVVVVNRTTTIPGRRPTFALTTFGLDGNKGILCFEPAKAWPPGLPWLVRMPPDPETVALADAMFDNAVRPYEAAALTQKSGEK